MRIAKKQRYRSVSIPAPIGGWNDREPLGDMDDTEAVELINIWPSTSDVQVRKGYTLHSGGFPSGVETLMSYNGANTSELLAISNGNIYNSNDAFPANYGTWDSATWDSDVWGGGVGTAEVTGLTNSRWEWVNVATSGGNFLYAVNGEDDPLLYNGTTWTSINGSSSPSITGVTTANLNHVNLFKTRLWFIQKNTLKIWYLPVNSVGGAASSFDFQSIARRGGYLVAMGNWTIDAGSGVDDLAVFFTSEGEVIVYSGTDPSSANTWSLVGVWEIGAPIGKRCMLKWKGDLLLITREGVVPMSEALQSANGGARVPITDKIQNSVSRSAISYSNNFGWQIIHYPAANMIILNVPIFENADQEQYVMNTITGAWARFQGWDANCWVIHENNLYFGGNQIIGRAWNQLSDDGLDITALARQAFNYFGSRGRRKRFTHLRPVFSTNGSVDIYTNINVDFRDMGSTSLVTYSPAGAALWDSAVWDQDVWSSEILPQTSFTGATGEGLCASVRVQTTIGGIQLHWISTDVVMEDGAIL